MVDIETWRARIGSFNVSTGGPSHGRTRVLRPSTRKWPLTVIILLTMLTSNVDPALGIGSAAPKDCFSTTDLSPHDVTLVSYPPPPRGVLNEDINLTCPAVTSNLDSTLTSPAATIITSGNMAFSNYSCTLTALNMNGNSSPITCSFRAPQDVPSDAYYHFTVTPPMTSIMFSWQSPAWPNGIITGYSLIVQQRTSQLGLSNMNYLECVLQPGHQVDSSVNTSMVAGEEPHENVSALTTREDCTSVDNLMAVCTGNRTLIVSWNPSVDYNEFITGYSVVENNVTSDLPPHHTESKTATVPFPSAAVPYYITVIPVDCYNTSVDSSNIVNLTRELAPSVVPVTDPLHSNTVITVSRHPITVEETCENIPSTQSSVPVHKLDPRVSYSISVGTLNMDLTTTPQVTVPPPQIIAADDDNTAVYDMFRFHFDQLMINVMLWRATIGSFNPSNSGLTMMRGQVQQPSSAGEWSLLLAVSTVTVEVMTVTVILMLLMLSGDVELNPGPGTVLQAMKEITPAIIEAINAAGRETLVELARHLKKQGLIRKAIKHQAKKAHTVLEGANMLMTAIQHEVKKDTANFYKFLTALQSSDLNDEADMLKSACQQRSLSFSAPLPSLHQPKLDAAKASFYLMKC